MYELVIFDFVEPVPQGLDALRVQCTCGQTKVCEFHVAGSINKEVLEPDMSGHAWQPHSRLQYLGLKISMDVSELV